ncbi:Uncharacterised protein [Brevibacterium casei]|uniref:Uncharacterized protein n=1 Tax=Brevibacterium casei TaxID=33889 RepID=A0A449DB02_9MICO|nr:Uncharacterised protein [Brevibacterium casei]
MSRNIFALAISTATAALLIALLLISWPDFGLQPLGIALALAGVAGLNILIILYSRRRHRALIRAINDVDKRMSRVEYRTEPVHDIRGSVAKTSAGVREILTHLREVASGEADPSPLGSIGLPGSGSQPYGNSMFAPGSIPANAVQTRPTMHAPGRDAARQVMKVPGERNLARLLLAGDIETRREVAYIGGRKLVPFLESVARVTIVAPGTGEFAIPAETAFLVIDVASLSDTGWSGVLDASRTRMFQELRDIVLAARKRGVAVVVCGEVIPSHFTDSLHELAHVRVKNDGSGSTRWGDDVSSVVLDAIADYASQTKYTADSSGEEASAL